jgi:hypothetical protein
MAVSSICRGQEIASVSGWYERGYTVLEPLRLKDLRMTQSFIKLDPLTMPHLRHLTCLHLLNMKMPSNLRKENLNASEDTSSEGSGERKAQRKSYIESKMSDFWLALQGAGVYLKEIKVDDINDEFLGYLTRYTGLTKLGVSSHSLPKFSDSSAKLFFVESLPSHAETLEELDIEAEFEDLWCFGEHNVSAFSRCMGLKTLSVCVSRADLSARGFSPDFETGTAQNRSGIVVSSRVQPEYSIKDLRT